MVKFLDAMRLSNSVADLKLMIWFLTRIWEYLSLSQDCSVSMILEMEIWSSFTRTGPPNKSICLVGKFFFSKKVPKQKIRTDPRLGWKEMYVDLISSFKICADKSPVSMLWIHIGPWWHWAPLSALCTRQCPTPPSLLVCRACLRISLTRPDLDDQNLMPIQIRGSWLTKEGSKHMPLVFCNNKQLKRVSTFQTPRPWFGIRTTYMGISMPHIYIYNIYVLHYNTFEHIARD